MGLDVRGLAKRFGRLRALDGIDLDLAPGTVLALFGPNGAGKTTLVKVLAGLMRPTEGRLLLDGEDMLARPAALRRRIGLLTHSPYLYGELTARENLHLYATLYSVERRHERVEGVLAAVGMAGRGDDRVKTFSRGMLQRVAIARVLIHSPDLMLLDEPYSGLDPRAAEMLTELLRGVADDRRILILTTHDVHHGLELATEVAIQVRGRIAFRQPARALTPQMLGRTYHDLVSGAEV